MPWAEYKILQTVQFQLPYSKIFIFFLSYNHIMMKGWAGPLSPSKTGESNHANTTSPTIQSLPVLPLLKYCLAYVLLGDSVC